MQMAKLLTDFMYDKSLLWSGPLKCDCIEVLYNGKL